MGLTQDKFESAIRKMATQIKKDGNWKYSQSCKDTFAEERKANRSFNCAQGVCMALKDIGIIPKEGWFYFKNGELCYSGSTTVKNAMKKAINKKFDFILTSKPKKYDIVGFDDITHTCVYLGDGLYADFGTKANVKVNGVEYKRNIIANHTYGDHKPYVVLRLKTEYYPKYTGKEKSSISRALKSMGIDESYEHRCDIARWNNITNYKGSASQNLLMLKLLKEGKLIK